MTNMRNIATKVHFIDKPFRPSDRYDWFFSKLICALLIQSCCASYGETLLNLTAHHWFVPLPDILIKVLMGHYRTWPLWLLWNVFCLLTLLIWIINKAHASHMQFQGRAYACGEKGDGVGGRETREWGGYRWMQGEEKKRQKGDSNKW